LHHIRAARELAGGGEDQADGARKGNWESDGKGGPSDPHTSMKILLDWWMTEGNYSRFCGKNNDVVKKNSFATTLRPRFQPKQWGPGTVKVF
jgi:hypothetical protein